VLLVSVKTARSAMLPVPGKPCRLSRRSYSDEQNFTQYIYMLYTVAYESQRRSCSVAATFPPSFLSLSLSLFCLRSLTRTFSLRRLQALQGAFFLAQLLSLFRYPLRLVLPSCDCSAFLVHSLLHIPPGLAVSEHRVSTTRLCISHRYFTFHLFSLSHLARHQPAAF